MNYDEERENLKRLIETEPEAVIDGIMLAKIRRLLDTNQLGDASKMLKGYMDRKQGKSFK